MRVLISGFFIFFWMLSSYGVARADICYPTRKISEWSCTGCNESDWRCSNATGAGDSSCDPEADIPCGSYALSCSLYCIDGSGSASGEDTCSNYTFNVNCSSEPSCSYSIIKDECTWTGSTCNDGSESESKGCWGPGGTHSECGGGSCIEVAGDGANTCSIDADCDVGGGDPGDPATHLECVGLSCQTVDGDAANTCSVSADCNPSYTVSGTVYLDSSGACSDTSNPVQPGAGAQVTIPGEAIGSVAGGGTYSIGNVDIGTQVVTLSGMDSEYQCSCPGSCQSSVSVTGNTTVNYFVTGERNAWWQTTGGDVGVNNGNLSSSIPSSCTPGLCYPFMSRGTSESSGVLTYTSGTNGFGDGGSASEGVNFLAESPVRVATRREGYDYFYRIFEVGLSPVDDFPIKTSVDKPSAGPSNGRAYFSSGTLTLNGSDWTLAPGESMVIFVDGNLAVQAQIDVPVSAFLAFIVSGDITFTTGTATHTSEVAQVEGVFISDGVLQTNTGTDKFVAEGTYVGWGGVVFNRDFSDTDNNSNPTEYFIFRPDFVINAPARMKRPVIRWEEIAP